MEHIDRYLVKKKDGFTFYSNDPDIKVHKPQVTSSHYLIPRGDLVPCVQRQSEDRTFPVDEDVVVGDSVLDCGHFWSYY